MADYTVTIEHSGKIVGFATTKQLKPAPGQVTLWQEVGGIGTAETQRIPVQQEPDQVELIGIGFTDKGLHTLGDPVTLADALNQGPFRLTIQDADGNQIFSASRCMLKDPMAFATVPISEATRHSVVLQVFDS